MDDWREKKKAVERRYVEVRKRWKRLARVPAIFLVCISLMVQSRWRKRM